MWIVQAIRLWWSLSGKRHTGIIVVAALATVVVLCFGYLAFQGMSASAAYGEFAVYRESTGFETIGTTVVTLDWDTTVNAGSGYSIDSGRTDITLADTGHYLVLYSLGIESSGGSNRSEVQGTIEFDGNTMPWGRSSCTIRRTNGQNSCEMAGAAILEATSTDRVIRIQAQRTDTNTATVRRSAGNSGISILALDEIWDYARIRAVTGGQTFNSSTFETVNWDTNDELDTATFSRSSGAITLAHAGNYLVTFNVAYTLSTNARRNLETRLTLNGYELPGTRVTAFMEGSTNNRNQVATWVGIVVATTTNQVLRVQGRCEQDCGSTTLQGNRSGITIAKIPDTAELARLGEVGGGQAVDASNDPITWDTQYEIDANSFSHSTSSDTSRLTVEQSGDYLFFGSFLSTRNLVTTNYLYPAWRWRVNTGVQPYGSFGAVSRGTAGNPTAGNSAGFLAYNLSSGDYVELANTDVSTGADSSATFTAERMSMQGVRIATLFIEDVTVATTGVMIATTSAPSGATYFGGAFTIKGNRATTTVNSIVLTEIGSINASSSLTNTRLFYELDTTNPYDCASESYSGSELQYGATTTFSGANGTSSFSGSVSVGRWATMCVYVVSQTTASSTNGETIRFRITNPSNDVVIGSGTVGPGSAVTLSGSTTVEDDYLEQTSYHWRNDDGSEITATSATGGSENTPLVNLQKATTTRLRVQVANTGSASSSALSYRLEYAAAAPTCAAASAWTMVGDTNAVFVMSPTANLIDGADTTNIPVSSGGTTDTGTFTTPNGGVHDVTATTSPLLLGPGRFTEFEFSILATASSTEGTTYCFRATASGTVLSEYDQYPQATIAADVVASSTGVMIATVDKNTANVYVGGAFALRSESGTRTVSSITITETGTVNGATGIENVRLHYEYDTTMPRDCASESYSGSETQFGITDVNGFSGANGSSTFSDSVDISTTQTMCVYVVLDITVEAMNANTIAIQIANPSNDVVATGSVAPSTSVALSGATIIEGEILLQYGYHWRNDNGPEATSTSATAGVASTTLTNVSIGVPYRLRTAVQNTGGATSSARQFRIEYGVKGTTCAAVGAWIDVGATGGAWDMSETPNLVDGSHTTNISVALGGIADPGVGTFLTPNSAVKDISSQTAGITLVEQQFVELEFALEATPDATFGTTYCFRLSSAGTVLDAYAVYAEATLRPNQDFYIQRGTATHASGSTTVAVVAGVHYVAPRDPTRAFVRITNTSHTGAGTEPGGGTQNANNVTTYIDNPESIATGFDIVRFGTTGTTRTSWEIVEYIGPPGGDNEIIVRKAADVTFVSTSLTATATVPGVVDDSDVVVFVTGSANPSGAATSYQSGLVVGEWNGIADVVTLRRGITGSNAIAVSYAVVEFIGQNWRIQRAERQHTVAGSAETSTISPVNNLSRAFLHVQKRITGGDNGIDEFGHEVWLSASNTISFLLESTATTPSQHNVVAWVIENTQTSGTPMIVTRSNGTQSGGPEPSVVNVNIGTTIASMDVASIFTVTRSNGVTTTFPRPIMAVRLISTTQYELWISDTGQTRTYRTEVVEWPTAELLLVQNYYRFYVDNGTTTPSDPWPLGPSNLGENTAILSSNSPPTNGSVLRIRMSIRTSGGPLSANQKTFKLQWGQRPDSGSCSMIGTWSDLGGVGSTTALWRGYNSTTTDGSILSGNPPSSGALVLSVSDRAGTLHEENPTVPNPYRVAIREDIEYDWVVQHNNALESTVFCFRMVESNGTLLHDYEYYPTVTTGGFSAEVVTWRFYGDETNVTPTVPLAATNTAPINVAFDDPIKLRLLMREVSGGASPMKYKLQFSRNSNFSSGVFDVADFDQCVVGSSSWCYVDGAGVEHAFINARVFSTADTCVGGVGSGCGTHNEYSYVPRVIGEVGTITATSGPYVVSLQHTYTNPVIITESISGDTGGGSANRPAAAVIIATSSTSFTVRIQEPDNESDTHGSEQVSYIVIEAGSYTLPGGMRVEAGTKQTSSYYGNAVTGTSDDTCVFGSPFSTTPVVFSALQSNNNTSAPDFLTASQLSVTSSQFTCSIEVPDGEVNEPTNPEIIGWIAFTPGAMRNNGIDFLVATTTTTVQGWTDTPWHVESFPPFYFGAPPFGLVVTKQTRNGAEGGWVRYGALSADSVALAIDERDDGERAHTNERVGLLAFSGGGTIIAAGTSTAVFPIGASTEFEFTLRNAGALPNTTYFFRVWDTVNNEAPPLAASSSYPSLTTEGASLVFSLSGIPGATTLQGITTSATTTATAVPFGKLTFGTSTTAAQRLTISTNAPKGYSIFVRQTSALLSSGGAHIPDIAATNASPQPWSTACNTTLQTGCWGYRTGDVTLSGGSTRFLISDRYAALSTSTAGEVAYASVPVSNEHTDIVYRLQITETQPAGLYKNNVVFIAVPIF